MKNMKDCQDVDKGFSITLFIVIVLIAIASFVK